jgi:hypothetical protein
MLKLVIFLSQTESTPKHFFRKKALSKLIHTHTSISDASSENNCEDDFSGSDDDFLGFYDEYIILWFLIFVRNNPVFSQ